MHKLSYLLPLTLLGACANADVEAPPQPVEVSVESVLAQPLIDLQTLSSDEMDGRYVGSEGGALARAYILQRFEEIGLEPVNGSYEQAFSFERPVDFRDPDSERVTLNAVNVLGLIEGENSDHVIVITAHYDHLGHGDGEIYNGADDNASGVAGILAIAEHFMANPPEHTVMFAALDAEEGGLRGARYLVENRPEGYENFAFNLNLDMLGYNEHNELYAVGSYHYPALVPIIDAVSEAAAVSIPRGFDEPSENPGSDWTLLSDHGAFHIQAIPFIYLGVDYHPHYHQVSDEYENMTLDFFQNAVAGSVLMAEAVDAQLAEIVAAPSRAAMEGAED